ncbi:MAG: nucleotide exchange factor GrpE [Candidatus Andersenbacteria bacterium RIFCSPHIGHO2_12_FULL_46_9]|nr:MAG: Protein GrpE [Parcubacteria group bacterium GW2011_GWA2_45_14]OGY33990.1 MAG: nucleotide exchange factor GrpE [Candidatus Andersenbacteria bacterium RIFCSPHIGHO2_02_FULL_46_16]OGY35318.1 MAG: nucleotide exchange factor GrpE [Candidatus Andersenbacteria bacterium RIFCSPHIGHO2_12_FULL_46_9]OGY36992.1 MAG: nucleotide exchange factor GrpE [Candidatus Andersenbacteria bacterium RIFCSPLOWO2_02_FULL_46_11]HBE90299.1 nucleotide exchange factor GrpE [Candidatus Andersenbacteria bacterium]
MLHSSEIHSISKASEYLSGWQRAQADLDNYRRRVHQEQHQQNAQVKRRLIYDLMPLIDNFRAITIHLPADLKDNVWAQGVLHVARQLEQLLHQYEVVPINESGQPFNPILHEAVATVKDDAVSSGSVVEVMQTGYRIGDQVIRPAKVKVAK